ncbi:MAG: M28 family peptidase [bacterium]
MKRLILILLFLLASFMIVTVVQSSIPFRLTGPILTLRLVMGATSFMLGVSWILFSLFALPRALASVFRNRKINRKELRWGMGALLTSLAPLILIGTLLLVAPSCCTVKMPGKSYAGPLPALTPDQTELRERLRNHVVKLASDIGTRSAATHYRQNLAAADYIAGVFSNAGFSVTRESFIPTAPDMAGKPCVNIIVEIKGTSKPDEIVVIGAHYDTAVDTPGANDNASGVAATLELARAFSLKPCPRTLRFIAFANEEPPFFWTIDMGSAVHAVGCRKRQENITAMLSLETIGCYSDAPGSQNYPARILGKLYPTTGNFIGFIGNTSSGRLVYKAVESFRKNAKFPSEGAALPSMVSGVGWSDHWGFWQQGYSAIEITDTAPFRYPYYHTDADTPDKINFDRYATVVSTLIPVISDLAH